MVAALSAVLSQQPWDTALRAALLFAAAMTLGWRSSQSKEPPAEPDSGTVDGMSASRLKSTNHTNIMNTNNTTTSNNSAQSKPKMKTL